MSVGIIHISQCVSRRGNVGEPIPRIIRVIGDVRACHLAGEVAASVVSVCHIVARRIVDGRQLVEAVVGVGRRPGHADHRRPVARVVILIGGRQAAARLGQ